MNALFALPLVFLAQTSSPPTVSFRKTESVRKDWYEMQAVWPQFKGNAVADVANQHLGPSLIQAMDTFRKETVRDGKPMRPHAWAFGCTVSIAQPELISIFGSTYWDTGGAHPNSILQGYNYGMVKGRAKRLVLADLLRAGVDPVAKASEWVLPKLKARGASSIVDGEITKLTQNQADNFVITPSGITWLLSKYEVASYAEGEFEVRVAWAEMAGSLNPSGPQARWSK